MHLGEQIEQQTGLKLPIGSGRGSLTDPVQITTAEPRDAMHAICSALDVIHSLSAKAWCMRSWPRPEEDLPGILVAEVESNWIEGDEVLRDRRSYFFATPDDDTARHISADVQLPMTAVGETGVHLPFNVAWLNLRNISEPDADNPGAGIVLTYESAGMKGSFTVYDEGKPLADGAAGEERLVKAFYRAVGDLTLNSQCGEPVRSGALHSQAGELIWMFADFEISAQQRSWLAMTRLGAHLLKFRLSLQADEEAVLKNADETLQFVFRMVHRDALTPAPLPSMPE